jgi:hypothetical protein
MGYAFELREHTIAKFIQIFQEGVRYGRKYDSEENKG